MNEGSLAATFLIVFRETLEASLIVGIICAVLYRLGQSRFLPHVFASSFAGVLASLVGGFFLFSLAQSVRGRAEEILEGVISIAACAVLTHMIFWMDRQAKQIKPELEAKVEQAVTKEEMLTIVALPFIAVFREGAETVLFLSAISMQSSSSISLGMGSFGFLLAVLIGVLIFAFGKKVPLRQFFRSTGVLLLLMAAGLLAYGIHELHEAGWIPPVIEHVWDTNHILNEKGGPGSFAKALFGYNGNPSLVEVTAYVIYLSTIVFFLKQTPKAALKHG